MTPERRRANAPFKQTHCIVADVTERTRVEQELQQSQALLQAAMDRSQAGIAAADVSSRSTSRPSPPSCSPS